MNNHTQNPPSQSVSDLENQLIDLSILVGSIAEGNSMFTKGLADYIDYLGKPLAELTLSELVELTEEYREAFNHGTVPVKERISDSGTKQKSLRKQHEVIGTALAIFEVSNTQENRLKAAKAGQPS